MNNIAKALIQVAQKNKNLTHTETRSCDELGSTPYYVNYYQTETRCNLDQRKKIAAAADRRSSGQTATTFSFDVDDDTSLNVKVSHGTARIYLCTYTNQPA